MASATSHVMAFNLDDIVAIVRHKDEKKRGDKSGWSGWWLSWCIHVLVLAKQLSCSHSDRRCKWLTSTELTMTMTMKLMMIKIKMMIEMMMMMTLTT